jgi:creatinine amidohydrolase
MAQIRFVTTLLLLTGWLLRGQPPLSVKWEDLTAGDFVKAIERSQGSCVLPIGIIEKHGPHLPLGSDLIQVRYAALHGAGAEYSIVYPEYYFGQIFEAQHQPGTIAYSAKLQLELLEETTAEMARNGCKKIIIANGHGGNNHLLPFFAQSQLASPRDYVVYIFQFNPRVAGRPPLKTDHDGHAGEGETSAVMVARPDLVRLDRAGTESPADLKRQDLPPGVFTGIGWYSRFPEHYAGDATGANRELGEFDMKAWSDQIAGVIRAVKADRVSLRLQNEFFEKKQHPLDTKQ